MEKFNNIALEREDKYENVLRKEKAQEYLREKKLDNILQKMKKIDEMK